jgi:hypothetical protein
MVSDIKGECSPSVFESRVLRRIFSSKTVEIVGDQTKLHN